MMSGLIYRWHEDGTLVELQEKWDLKPSPWIADMHSQLGYDDAYLDN
jgi:polar amino acid transport system substrate-binding protein